MKTQDIKIKGYNFTAYESGSSLYVRATDVAKQVRQIIKKELNLKPKVNTRNGGSVYVTFPKGTDQAILDKAKELTYFMIGSNFDSMTDCSEVISYKSDDGRNIYFHADYIFIQQNWM